MNEHWKALIEEAVGFRTDADTPPEEVARIREEITARIQEKMDRCRRRTLDEWTEESVALSSLPVPDTPEKAARAREMAARKARIDRFLEGDGPEPEWPWSAEHTVSDGERKREIAEAAEAFARNCAEDRLLWGEGR